MAIDSMSETASSHPVLAAFHPAVRTWFERRFPVGPTPPQTSGWPLIRAGSDTLIAAPTGSGKTLSAFLVCIDQLYRAGTGTDDGIRVVYVSPLKALTVDIRHNLETPLAEIAEVARELGYEPPLLRTAVRSGDSKASERAAMLKRPPHFLITTPESLYLMLTAERSRDLLASVQSVIVDEIHALSRDKRGSHLSLSLERLQRVTRQRPVRIGLSATQRPIERIAEFLVGASGRGANGDNRCSIVDHGHRRAISLELVLPERELSAVASAEQIGEVLDKLAAGMRTRRTTLVFVNTRRLSERIAHQLALRLGDDQVAAHHGSLSKERRLAVETRLRNGELRALVATASLELGIDVGPVELVVQIGSPRSIATFLQRVGRSGHNRFASPVGHLCPLTRDELVECGALLASVKAGELDRLIIPDAPLDVLAQQLVAECATADYGEDDLFELMRGAAPYRQLQRADFDAVLELVSEGVVTGRGKRAAYLHRDRVNSRVSGRRGARLAALTSGGAIPDAADYRVIAEPDDTFVGTINEDFAIESMAGDVFLLGSTAWRIRRVERGVVRVTDAKGATSTLPFWLGEAPARTWELSEAVSQLRSDVGAWLEGPDGVALARAELAERLSLGADASRDLVEYLAASRTALGLLPTSRDLVFERFFDDTGGMQLVVHAPLGGRINRALGLLLRKRFCRSFDFELQAAASDDSIVLSLGPQHSFPLEDLRDFLKPSGVQEALTIAVLGTPMFSVRWRWNLNRALVVLRFRGGKRNPPELQRMEADDITAAVFPALAACQDNATGPREIPDHVLVRQTLHDCLTEAMDVVGLTRVLTEIAAGQIRLHFRETTEPSPLAHEILNSRPYTFLDDAPLEERRTRAVQLRRGLPTDARELSRLEPEAIARVRAEAMPDCRSADELHDLLLALFVCPRIAEHAAWFEQLRSSGRALLVELAGAEAWCGVERRATLEALFPSACFRPDLRFVNGSSEAAAEPERWCRDLVRGHLETRGPSTRVELLAATLLTPTQLEVGLAALESEGSVVRGHFEPNVAEEQFVARRLLARIHGYTIERLRREIEPVSAQDFMRFLLNWQRVTPSTRREGRAGVLAAIEQLQGFEAAVASWEPELLAARVHEYRSEWLDSACWSGDVVWGRLSPRAPQLDEAGTLLSTLSRATPVTLATRGDFAWLLTAARGDTSPREPLHDGAARVLQALRQRGALFAAELTRETGLSRGQVEEGLWDCVARGFVASDGFEPIRALGKGRGSFRSGGVLRAGLRRGAAVAGEGRWALLPPAEALADREMLAEAVAEQLLSRWGVVVREVLQRETLSVPFRDVVWALRRLEDRGTVRGGRFVAGLVGEQFALPEAVEQLRGIRKSERTSELVRVSACDPLNLVGIILPGSRVPAVRAQHVTYRDGAHVVGEGAHAPILRDTAEL